MSNWTPRRTIFLHCILVLCQRFYKILWQTCFTIPAVKSSASPIRYFFSHSKWYGFKHSPCSSPGLCTLFKNDTSSNSLSIWTGKSLNNHRIRKTLNTIQIAIPRIEIEIWSWHIADNPHAIHCFAFDATLNFPTVTPYGCFYRIASICN